jgi:hypothetical protein
MHKVCYIACEIFYYVLKVTQYHANCRTNSNLH